MARRKLGWSFLNQVCKGGLQAQGHPHMALDGANLRK